MCGLSLVQKRSEMHRPVCLVSYRYLWRGKSRKKVNMTIRRPREMNKTTRQIQLVSHKHLRWSMFFSEPFLHRDQRAITIEIAFRKAHSCYTPSLLFHTMVTADRPHIIGVPMLPLPLWWITNGSNRLHFHFDVLTVNWLNVRKLTVSSRLKETSEPDLYF